MDSELIVSLTTLKERKRLLGFMEDPSDSDCHRKRPSEDPFPLRGGTQTLVEPKKFKTLPRKPKKLRMADKPPLAPKPPGSTAPIPKPRKKGPPPNKPVPYHKHREHREQDVSTFKSNHPIQQSVTKPPPPQVAEKPPRRYSTKGEPSSEFYKPKRVEQAPIQYGIPSVPSQLQNKGATIDSRPRLDTPLHPPEPPAQVLSNGSEVKEASGLGTNSSVSHDTGLYSQAYDQVENGDQDVEDGYAVVSPTRAAARPPKPVPQSVIPQTPPSKTPPPLSPRPPPSPLAEQAQSPTRKAEPVPPTRKAEPVPPTRKVEPMPPTRKAEPVPPTRKVEPVPLARKVTPTTQLEGSLEGCDVVSPTERVEPVPPARKAEPVSPKRKVESVPPVQKVEPLRKVSPASIPASPNEYNVTVHATSPKPGQEGYSQFNRPGSASNSPSFSPALQLSLEYSAIDVTPVLPPPAGNPTQQAGYGQLQSAVSVTSAESEEAQRNGEYELIGTRPFRSIPDEQMPKVKARNASQKVKSGNVQLQSARDRSEFTTYGEDLAPAEPKTHSEKPVPPSKPARPPLTYERPEAVRTPEPVTERATTHLSNEELERAGYETVDTLGPMPSDDETAELENVDEEKHFPISPKVEVDIDHIRKMHLALNNQDSKDIQPQESSFEDMATNDVTSQQSTEPTSHTEDPEAGLVLHSPDMFIVPQHAVPGPRGYCEVDVLSSDQQRSLGGEEETVGAGVVEGDSITVHHHSYPNAEGYCDLTANTTNPPASVGATGDGALYSDVGERSVATKKESVGTAEAGATPQEPNAQRYDDISSSQHTYEIVPESSASATPNLKQTAPAVKPKPRKESVDTETPPMEDTTTTSGSPKRSRKSRPKRRAPPPPPTAAKSFDDNVLSKKDTPARVAGDIATLPRRQKSLMSSKSPPNGNNSDAAFSENQPLKLKTLPNKGIPSPKHSPKGLKRFFAKKPSSGSSPEPSKKVLGWRKKSLRGNKDEPVVPVADKTKSLPAAGRSQPLPTLDTVQDEDADDMYATIADTLSRQPPTDTSPTQETRKTSGGSKDFEPRSKRRSSFRSKKEKIQKPIRKSNSAEHLYDTADKTNNRARLPNPDEVHAGLYAMVTSRPKGTEQTVEVSPPPVAEASNGSVQSPKRNSASPSKSSLYEQEGLVVTSLDDKFGVKDTEEIFVSSSDIVHTVSSEGSVYAIVKNKPKSKKKSVSTEETDSQVAQPSNRADDVPSIPRKPPRSPAVARKPPPYRGKKSTSSDTSPTAVSPMTSPMVDKQPPGKAASGPPSFPPPPPPMSKSVTPEPEAADDPAYEIVTDSKKKATTARPKKLVKPQDEGDDGVYSVVKDHHTAKVNGTPQELVHIDDVLRATSPSNQRPPHFYSTIQENEEEGSPTVAIPMVSHGYATVTDKAKTSKTVGQANKKKPTGSPRLPPRSAPPPPPPGESKGGAAAHKPLKGVASTPLELESPEAESGFDSARNKRTLSFGSGGRTEQSNAPKFLFSQKLCQSLIAVGDGPETTPSPYPSTSTLLSVDDDSDGDIVYSTDWDSFTDEEEEERETTKRPKVYYIAREILTTERTFVKGLILLDKDFRQAVRSANNAHDKPVIADDAIKLILGNVTSLLSLNSDMLKDLEERMCTWDDDPRIGDILRIRAPYLKIYTEYISKFDKALKTLDEWTKKSPQFAEVVHEFEAQPKCASIPIAGYMLDIVQRITRYKLLMADYVKHLPADSDDREDSERALESISSTATHVNETIRQMDNFRKVCEVRKKLIGDAGDTLITPYRKLLKEGELLKFSRKEKQPRMFFLFNDILIYASSIPPANNTYRVIKRIPLEGMKVESLDDPEMKYGFQIVSTCKSFRLEASNREEKTQWLTAFEIAIKEQTERTQNREKTRQILADGADETGSVPLGHLAPPWLPDSAVSMCQLCSVTFTVTRRRHHCRACGMIFCSDCSSYYAPLKYMNNKSERVCQSCYGKICSTEGGLDKSPHKRPGRLSRGLHKMVNMPSVLREVKARDQSAHVSGYLNSHTSKSKRWKKRWYVVYNLVLYEFERHEDVSAKRSITLPSYTVISPVPRHDDPLVFVLKHEGAGKEYFKAENEDQLERWVNVLTKAVRGEIDQDVQEEPADNNLSPKEPSSPHSLDSS